MYTIQKQIEVFYISMCIPGMKANSIKQILQ